MRLGDVCTIYTGTGFPVQYQGNSQGKYPFYKVGDIAKNVTAGKVYLELCDNYVETDVVKKIKGSVLPARTVVFAKIGEAVKLNRRAITSCECLIDNNAMGIAPNEAVLTLDYFYHYMCQLRLETLAEATTVPSVKKSIVENLDIPVPSIAEQRVISKNLNKVSELIVQRKEQLAKLDQLVKSRFIELFGEWKSDPEPLKSFLEDITYGFTNPMPDAEEGPWKVTAKDVINGKVNYDTARKTTVQAFDELTAKSKPAVGDVLLTKDGTLGRCAVVEEDGICVNQSVAVLKCNNKILPKFLAILLHMPEYQREMLKNAGGGTIKHIYITKVVDMLIMVPTISQQLEFLAFVEQTDKSKFDIKQSLEKLEMLKKSLMQQYFG